MTPPVHPLREGIAAGSHLMLAILATLAAFHSPNVGSAGSLESAGSPELLQPAATVQGLAAVHRAGQTFVTWISPAGLASVYRVYGRTSPISVSGDLATAELLSTVGDSTWCDRRLSQIRGILYGYAIDSLAAPLTSSKGLAVVTASVDRSVYYAVTVQLSGNPEDRTIVPGQNSLMAPVVETVGVPRPVYQRTLTSGSIPFDVYTLWTSHRDTPQFPAMASVAGLAFDCAVVRGSPGGSLLIKPHARAGNFLNNLFGTGIAGEWRLTLDDWLYLASDRNSFWYGYHGAYDPLRFNNPTPAGGVVYDYTLRRIVHTVAWTRSWFPVDKTRVYAMGGSMGGIGSLMLAYRVPDWIAAIQAVIPKFDFSFTTDPNPANLWNAGSPERLVGDHLWGTVAANLPTNEGMPVYSRVNEGFLAGHLAGTSLPVILAFNGRNDTVVGWAEKIPYYAATQSHRHGGYYFFDQRTHNGTIFPIAWSPMQDARYLYRFRTNRSYPALSNCSADHDPGDGHAADGDSVGTLNGFVEWDTTLVDEPARWEVVLRIRNLNTLSGPMIAPESLTVDATPRRLQSLVVEPGAPFSWRVDRISDGHTVQSGPATADALGLVTIPGVKVYRSGVRLVLEATTSSAGDPPPVHQPGSFLQVVSRPGRGRIDLIVDWPGAGEARVDVFDSSGRRVRTLLEAPVSAGRMEISTESGILAAGCYFVRAMEGSNVATARLIITKSDRRR